MHEIFHEYLDKFVIIYIDDILIYSKDLKEHEHYLDMALGKLRENKLYAKESKCEFAKTHVDFLGYIVGDEGVQVDQAKIKAIKE